MQVSILTCIVHTMHNALMLPPVVTQFVITYLGPSVGLPQSAHIYVVTMRSHTLSIHMGCILCMHICRAHHRRSGLGFSACICI